MANRLKTAAESPIGAIFGGIFCCLFGIGVGALFLIQRRLSPGIVIWSSAWVLFGLAVCFSAIKILISGKAILFESLLITTQRKSYDILGLAKKSELPIICLGESFKIKAGIRAKRDISIDKIISVLEFNEIFNEIEEKSTEKSVRKPNLQYGYPGKRISRKDVIHGSLELKKDQSAMLEAGLVMPDNLPASVDLIREGFSWTISIIVKIRNWPDYKIKRDIIIKHWE